MAEKRATASGGAPGGDTARRVFDRDAYAAKARESDAKAREEGKLRAEAAAAGKKFRRAQTPPDVLNETEARRARLDVSAQVGKISLVPAGAGVGRRGKGAGFYCEVCDITLKDSISYIDHLNEKSHLIAAGESGQVRASTVDEVRERLRWLKRKEREAKKDVVVDLDARLELNREREEQERAEKRRKRNEKRRKTPGGLGHAEIKVENDGIIN